MRGSLPEIVIMRGRAPDATKIPRIVDQRLSIPKRTKTHEDQISE